MPGLHNTDRGLMSVRITFIVTALALIILIACTSQSLSGVSSVDSATPSEVGSQESPSASGLKIAEYTLKDMGSEGLLFLDEGGKTVYRIESIAERRSLIYPGGTESTKGTFDDSDPVVHLCGTDNVNVIVFQEINDSQFSYRIVRVKPDVAELSRIETKQDKMELSRLRDGTVRLQSMVIDDFNDFGQYSVNPKLLITWDGKQLNPATQEAPSDDDLAETCTSIRWEFQRWKPIDPKCADPITKAPPRLAETVLQLYYSGHSRIAKSLYDKCWVGNSKDKKRYWQFLLSILKKAKHWKEVRTLNKM
jgi:hypothetical protein